VHISRIIMIATACAVLGAGAGAYLDGKIKRLFVTPQPPTAYADRVDRLDSFPPGGTIRFYGDSHVERGPWREAVSPEIANFGIGRDTATGLLDRICRDCAETVVVLIGVNDLIAGTSAESVASQIGEVLTAVDSDLYLLEVMPVRGRYAQLNREIAALNALLPDYCKDGCTLIPTWDTLAEDEQIKPSFSSDGLHLSVLGYHALVDVLRQALR